MATYAFAGGVAGINPWGTRGKVAFSGTWVGGDTWFLQGVSAEVGNFTIGLGNISNTSPTCGMIFGNRVYMGVGATFKFSDIQDATAWEEQATGAGSVQFLSQYGYQDTVNGFEGFQGNLAVFGRYTIQIWTVNADPAQFSLKQVLTNIGTQSAESVKALGELDVFFLDDTGVRSLRVRDSSLNAFAVDIGSPVDIPIQAAIQNGGSAPNSCGVIEPSTKRYWLFLQDTIYVLSYYPSLKITAWSTYTPTYQTGPNTPSIYNNNGPTVFWYGTSTDPATATDGPYIVGVGLHTTINNDRLFVFVSETPTSGKFYQGHIPFNYNGTVIVDGSPSDFSLVDSQTVFTPSKFVIFSGLVYCRSSDGKIFVYGGTDNNTYDNSIAIVESPWLDAKRPHLQKYGVRLNVAASGAWQLEVGMDPQGTTATQVVVPFAVPLPVSPNAATDSTFGRGIFSESVKGTHFKFKAYTSPGYVGAAVLSSTTEQYEPGAEQ